MKEKENECMQRYGDRFNKKIKEREREKKRVGMRGLVQQLIKREKYRMRDCRDTGTGLTRG